MSKQRVLSALSKYYIPYRPEFHAITDKDGRPIGENAALFLSDVFHWSDKGDDLDDWVYKSQQDMERETGLTRSKQDTARHKLVEIGVLEEERRGVKGILHYRLNMDRLANLLDVYAQQFAENQQTGLLEKQIAEKADCGNSAIQIVENQQTGEGGLQKINKQEASVCGNPTIQFAENPQSSLQKTDNLFLHNKHTEKQTENKSLPAQPEQPPEPDHQRLMRLYQDALGYSIPNGAQEGRAAKNLLRQYTVEEAIACYQHLKADPFWDGKHLSLASVHKQIGAWKSLPAPGSKNGRHPPPPDDKAARAWGNVLTAMRNFGRNTPLVQWQLDEPTVKALKGIGGKAAVCSMDTFNELDLKRSFIKAYHHE